jgi:hypothetical protein
MTLDWVRLPSAWINQRGLTSFRWENGGGGADRTAALMALTVIAHRADQENGRARVTYDDICDRAGLSRAKVSRGLSLLLSEGVIERQEGLGPSTFQLANFAPPNVWGKFPAASMYSASGTIAAFNDFHLRTPAELNALKFMLLVTARRDTKTNLANISYPKIEEYSGIRQDRIKSAISLLATHGLVHVEHTARSGGEVFGIANAYRLPGVEPRRHMGTTGRTSDESDIPF